MKLKGRGRERSHEPGALCMGWQPEVWRFDMVWDIYSSFRSMREQLQAGLSMGMAGIPWWTSDIGGFLGGQIDKPEFQELLVRWFAWGAFCPVFRMHGGVHPGMREKRNFVMVFVSLQWTG